MKKYLSLSGLVCVISIMIFSVGCKKVTLPEVVTSEVTSITLTTAVSGGEITSDGEGDILEKGVCWNTTGDPTIADSKTSNGDGSESFTGNILGLQKGSVYYVRAYATNSAGTAYGEQYVFSTKIDDADGNQYKTTLVGQQLWMAENLKTEKYNDNALISLVTDNTAWTTLTTPAYCYAQNNEELYKPPYGAMYNFYAVATGKLCPTGWHVPTDDDFKTLEISLGMTQTMADGTDWRGTDQGKQMKNTSGWNTGENGTNTSGLTVLPSGYRAHSTGISEGIGLITYFWTSTEQNEEIGIYRRLDGNNDKVHRSGTYKEAGKSIRCVKN